MRRVIASIVLAAPALAVPAVAAAPDLQRSISVTGEGSIAAWPDIAIVTAGVSTQGKTAQTAGEANNKLMGAILAALRETGIAAKDIRTSRFNLHPLYERHGNGNRLSGFEAVHQVTVTVHAVDKVAEVIDRMIGAGANDISGIQFAVDNTSKLLDQAQAEAVRDARRKAELLAKAAHVGVGRAIAITEQGAASPRPLMLRESAAAATPIAVGQEMLHVKVSVTFELQH